MRSKNTLKRKEGIQELAKILEGSLEESEVDSENSLINFGEAI
jgi:flagellar hook protein FlgE